MCRQSRWATLPAALPPNYGRQTPSAAGAQITGIYPAGGHNATVYVLTSNASGVNYNGTPYQPGQVYLAHSQVIGEAASNWQPVNGSGATSLTRAYSLFVNPYNPNELHWLCASPRFSGPLGDQSPAPPACQRTKSLVARRDLHSQSRRRWFQRPVRMHSATGPWSTEWESNPSNQLCRLTPHRLVFSA